jgi:hypothetical protein
VLVLLIDVSSSRTHLRRLGQVDGSSIVFKQLAVNGWSGGRDVNPMFLHLLEETHHHNGHAQTLREADIFAFSGGEDHLCLQLGGPDDRAASIADDVPSSGLGSGRVIHCVLLDPVTSEITINMDLKGLGEIRLQDHALVLGSQEIPAQVLDRISMRLLGVVREARTLMDRIGGLSSSRFLKEDELSEDAAVVPLFSHGSAIQVSTEDRGGGSSLVLGLGLRQDANFIQDLLYQVWLLEFNGILGRSSDLDSQVIINLSLISDVEVFLQRGNDVIDDLCTFGPQRMTSSTYTRRIVLPL